MNRRKARLNFCKIETVIPALFILTLFTSILMIMGMGETPSPKGKEPIAVTPTGSKDEKPPAITDTPEHGTETYLKYTTEVGYFRQDDPNTDDTSFHYELTNFGLITRPYNSDAKFDPDHRKPAWARFSNHVFELNKNSKDGTSYKFFLLARHGEGIHNVGEISVGTEAWNCYWSLQEGKDGFTWADAHLTRRGELQAAQASHAFYTAILSGFMRAPESYYVSPLWRCLQTAESTWRPLVSNLPADRPFKPLIKELLREVIGAHTCDRRSTKSQLRKYWEVKHDYTFEDGFTEKDELWKPKYRETDAGTDERSLKVLDELWKDDPHDWISVTAHSGLIASLLRVISHRKFALETGGVMPVLIKAEKVQGKRPVIEGPKFTTVSTCPKPTTPPKFKA